MRADGSVDGRRQTEAQKISSSFPTQKAQPDHKKRRQEASFVLPLRTPERIGLITYDAKDPLILDQGAPTLRNLWFADSALEHVRFELLVPPSQVRPFRDPRVRLRTVSYAMSYPT